MYNEISGGVTAAKGFTAAGALPGRARVREIRGGSVCSPSPTGSQSLPLASAKRF